jgi:hypothetical protein
MTERHFNQNHVNKRTFCDFIYAMPGYQFIINQHDKAELVGSTADLTTLSQTACELSETLLLGLQSVGKLMANAMENTEADISRIDLINTGHFISLVAESANAINEISVQTNRALSLRK